MKKSSDIIKDQKKFFNDNANVIKPILSEPFFIRYANKEQISGFKWLSDKKVILDYGCGTGTSIEAFQGVNANKENRFIGVDISEVAVLSSKKRYPSHQFFVIENNVINQLKDGSVDGAYLLHVLHHSHDHKAIFFEIYKKLETGGKFFLSDLSSNNPIISFSRQLFIRSPDFIRKKFADDLVVDGAIPEKYKVSPEGVIRDLTEVGFIIEEVGYGHLVLFCFAWIDRFLPLSRILCCRWLYMQLEKIEQKLLQLHLFKNRAEVFYIKCTK
jgi:SAM-dependent methyltransferase